MRPFCWHRWEWHSSVQIEHVATEGAVPHRISTEVSGACAKCGEPRIKIVRGAWYPPRTPADG